MFSLFKKITFVWALIGLAFSANAQSIYADQETNSTTATCLACSVTDPALAVDGDESTASTLTTNLSLLGGAVEQTLIFPVTGNLGDTVEIMLESSEALLDISLLGNVEVESKKDSVLNGDLKEVGVTSVSVLGARKFLVTFYPGAAFDAVSVKLNGGILGLLGSLNVYYARIFHENPLSGLTSCNTADSVSWVVNCPALGLLLPLCEVDNPQAIITPNPNDYATIKLQADLTASGGIGASYNTPACSTDSVSIILERPGSIINANLAQSSISFSTYLNGVQNSTEPLLAENLSVVSGASIYQYMFNPGVEFDSVSVDMNAGLLGLLTTLRVYNVCLLRKLPPMPDPVLGSSTRACYDGDLTINFQVPAGDNIRVYSERTRTTAPIYSGPTPFVATNLLMDTTFYVESFNPGIGCASESIDSIFIDVLDPVQPAIVEDLVVCYNTSARLAPLPGGSIFSFHADSNAAPVFTGGAFITDPIKNDTTFFIKNTIDNFCFEDYFHTLNISLLEEPQIASTVDTIGICEGGTDPIPVFVTDESVVGVTITYSVYDRDTVLLTTFNYPDTAFIPRSAINATIAGDIDTLIVDATSGTCRESANKQTLIVKVVDPLSVATPQVDTTIVCNTDSAVVRINTTLRGFDYNWYTDSIGGTIAYSGDSIFVSGLTDTLRLYVEASFGACQSQSRGEAVIIPLSATNNNFTSLDRNICIGDSTLLIATNDAGFDVTWYDALTDGNVIVNNDSLQTTVLTSDTTFYIDANSLNCASSTRFPVNVTRSAKPTIAVDKDQYYVCSGDDVALIANPSAGSTASWWTLSSAGTLVSTDNPFNFDSSALPANGEFTFFVQADNDMCPSLARVAVTVSNVDGSAEPFISATTPICKGDNAMLVASSPNVEGVEYTWWTASSGGVELARGDIYNTGEIQNDVTIYAQIEFGDSVCLNAGRRPQLIETLPVLDAPGNVRCTNTEGNSVSFAWDPVSGATEYEYDYTIEDGASGILRTTATTLDFTGLADGTTVTILVRAIGLPTLDCQTSEPGYASCTAGCPINNSRLNQLEYEICQNEQVEIIIELDQTLDPTVLANLQIGILGQPGTSQNLRYIYPDDFLNTPDLSNPLGTSVIDSIHFYIAYPSEEGCDSLVIPTRVVINTIPDIDPVSAIQVVALVPATVGQIVDQFQFSSNVPGGLNLLWDFGDGSTSTEMNPVHKFAVSDTPYRVTLSVTNSFGCASTVTYFRDIVVTSVPDVFIPNTFTPNGDGKNDGFRIFGEGITLENFQIFNVYGNIVFESEDVTEMWDGEFNGKPVQGGTYYYTATIKDFIGLTYEKEGSFTVIRK
jgi:gliding motility-associated-like protein